MGEKTDTNYEQWKTGAQWPQKEEHGKRRKESLINANSR
jgi:hypothetical protein